MGARRFIPILIVVLTMPVSGVAKDLTGKIRKAIEDSTLDQVGTKPFHLKAVLTPSFDRDKDSGRTGEVEIWWTSPTRWKRDIKSPEFHQTEIVDGSREWQKNEGSYFPEWLREISIELIRPVPALDDVLQHVRDAEVYPMMGQITVNWVSPSGTAERKGIQRAYVSLNENTGLLLYAGGFGWQGEFKDYADFHGRKVARTVNAGSPQVTAKVTVLEDLGQVPAESFNTEALGGDPQPLQTVLLDETTLRKNLLPSEPTPWPPLQDGVLEGNVTTNVVVDRDGKVRELGSIVSENSAINEAGRQRILAMHFTPFVVNGVPVQAMSQIMVPFHTVRPQGTEAFESARTYFERGRKVGFPGAQGTPPFSLKAEFDAGTKNGPVTGRYEDTWLSETQWRREAWFQESHYARSRNGDKLYQLAEGPETGLLRLVFRILEPITAIDTFQESDWRIKRDAVNGVRAIRVLSGYESPDGKLDPEQARGYWFDDAGLLLKTYFNGIETRRYDFEDFSGAKLSHLVVALKDDRIALRIRVTQVTPRENISPTLFELKGHPWQRAFTSEVR